MQQFNLNIFDYKLILVSILLFMHGFVYFNLSRGLFNNADKPLGVSVLVGNLVSKNTLTLLIKSLWLLAGLGFIVISIIIAISKQPNEIVYLVLLLSSIIGIISFALYWDGILNNLLNAGLIGVIIDIFVIIGVIIFN